MENKTIAVQTFWKSQFNYGQLLQGYALQQFLINNGYDSYIIRFDSILSRLKELIILVLKGKKLKLKLANLRERLSVVFCWNWLTSYQQKCFITLMVI